MATAVVPRKPIEPPAATYAGTVAAAGGESAPAPMPPGDTPGPGPKGAGGAASPTRPPVIRHHVRPKDGWMHAIPVTAENAGQVVRRPDHTLVVAQAGQYEIRLNGQVLDVVDEKTLQARYDVREEDALIIPGPIRRQIDERVGIGSTLSPQALLHGVTRLAALKVGVIEIPLTPGQWEEIRHRAEKNERSIETELRLVVQRIEDELFHGGVGRSAVGRV